MSEARPEPDDPERFDPDGIARPAPELCVPLFKRRQLGRPSQDVRHAMLSLAAGEAAAALCGGGADLSEDFVFTLALARLADPARSLPARKRLACVLALAADADGEACDDALGALAQRVVDREARLRPVRGVWRSPRQPAARVLLDTIDEAKCLSETRFSPSQLRRLHTAFRLPHWLELSNGERVLSEEALLVLMYRLAFPRRFYSAQSTFSRR